MSNDDGKQQSCEAVADDLSDVEQAAWLRLQAAERDVAAARHQVMAITNREGQKRRIAASASGGGLSSGR